MYYVPKNLRGETRGTYSSYDCNVKQMRRPLTLFKAQLDQVSEALSTLEIDMDIMKDNENLWLYPAANLEYGNMLRLTG